MVTTPKRRNARWPEGWRPIKHKHGLWAIDEHELKYADRRWNGFCSRTGVRNHIIRCSAVDKQEAIDALVVHMAGCQPWKLYAEYLVNTGGNDIAPLLACKTSPRINLPLFTIETAVASQVELLRRLAAAGLLRHPNTTR